MAKFIEEFIRISDMYGFNQRIGHLEFTPQPNAVLFKFRTTQPTVPIVEIFHYTRDTQGNLLFPADRVVTVKFDFISAMLGNYFTEHEGRIDGLEQDSLFNYRITAGNGSKRQAVAMGSFKTGRRSAAFVVRDIRVFNDGDPGIIGASGQMAFAFGFYNENDDRVGENYYHSSISSGELRSLPFGTKPAFQSSAAPDWMAVYVRGMEDDRFFMPFHPWTSAPMKLPENTEHYENDDIVVADAFQRLALPNEWGTHRVGFSLDSGPWGIHYIVTGWIDVENTPPVVLPVIPKSAQSLQMAWTPGSSAILSAVGQRVTVVHPNGHRSVYGLGPNGVLAHQITGEKFKRRPNWEMIEASGVDAASLVATEDSVMIAAVSAGAIRYRFDPICEKESATEWREIGSDFQPHLSAIALQDGTNAVLATGLDGTLRGMILHRNSEAAQWTDLGGGFAGRVIALPRKHGVEIFGLTPEGDIQTATWQPNSHKGLQWGSLEGESFVFIHAGEEDGMTHVIAVTDDHRVQMLSRESDYWPKCWVSLGTLDSIEKTG